MSIETTRLYCHDCGGYFTVDLDMRLDGQHEIVCPNCSHIHYRIVERGFVTGERYRSSSGMPIHTAYVYAYSSTATDSSSVFLTDAWASTSTSTTDCYE